MGFPRSQSGAMSQRIYSFIVNILGSTRVTIRNTAVSWHGLVTEVPGGKRRYVKELSQMRRIR